MASAWEEEWEGSRSNHRISMGRRVGGEQVQSSRTLAWKSGRGASPIIASAWEEEWDGSGSHSIPPGATRCHSVPLDGAR